MKRILVTGGAGFIGSNLCKKLLENGHFVVCLDNLFTGKEKNINSLKNNERFKFINHDVTKEFDENIDEIYNLACPASPIHYQEDAINTIKTSVLGGINMLELAVKYNAKFLQASTSEVYGDPLVHPQIETYWGNVNPIGIRSCYDEGKRCVETLAFDYRRKYSLDTKIVRIFNTYGPNMAADDGRVVSNFVLQALRNQDITIYGDGSQTRSFCYIDDLLDGLIKMMESNLSGPVNLGNPSERTILELAKLIIELTDSKSKISYKKLPADDPTKRQPDITLAINKLDWEPKIDIENGLLKTIEYFKEFI